MSSSIAIVDEGAVITFGTFSFSEELAWHNLVRRHPVVFPVVAMGVVMAGPSASLPLAMPLTTLIVPVIALALVVVPILLCAMGRLGLHHCVGHLLLRRKHGRKLRPILGATHCAWIALLHHGEHSAEIESWYRWWRRRYAVVVVILGRRRRGIGGRILLRPSGVP